jgi:phosphoglucosamine mutase
MTRLFGTDGVRGRVNVWPMTAEGALRLAMAASLLLHRTHERPLVVMGKDTRLSGYMLEPALVAGFTSMGVDVVLVGPVPTPGVAWLTQSMRADLGVMISASHNPYPDNGLKFFGADGFKLSDQAERQIEDWVAQDMQPFLSPPATMGRVKRLDDGLARYGESVKMSLPRSLRFHGLKVVVDAANGAAYKIAPQVLWELGAEVISLGVTPSGLNINEQCGALHTDSLATKVLETGADAGIALDGDADRLIMVDEQGKTIDGDQLLAVLTRRALEEQTLSGQGIAATVMSNMGLEIWLKSKDLELYRTQVGDRHVLEMMRTHSLNIGGEQSGHLILRDFATTGDGLLAALKILGCLVGQNQPLSNLAHIFEPFPQRLVNIACPNARVLEDTRIQTAVNHAKGRLGARGRILLRPSGTEPKIRLMIEGEDTALLDTLIEELSHTIHQTLKVAEAI